MCPKHSIHPKSWIKGFLTEELDEKWAEHGPHQKKKKKKKTIKPTRNCGYQKHLFTFSYLIPASVPMSHGYRVQTRVHGYKLQ